MTLKDIELFKNKFNVGDIISIPEELVRLTHEAHKDQVAEVVGKYRHFFNVKYLDLPYEQSIQYKDANKVHKFQRGVA
jgi:hypothetical protein